MKAQPTDLTDLGFDRRQFGDPAGWDVNSPSGYLYRILSDVATDVRERVGDSVYDGATSGTVPFVRLKQAEVYLAGAELWRRLEQFNASDVAIGRGGESAPPTISSRLLENASKFEERANALIEQVLSSTGQALGISGDIVQTGHHSEVRV